MTITDPLSLAPDPLGPLYPDEAAVPAIQARRTSRLWVGTLIGA